MAPSPLLTPASVPETSLRSPAAPQRVPSYTPSPLPQTPGNTVPGPARRQSVTVARSCCAGLSSPIITTSGREAKCRPVDVLGPSKGRVQGAHAGHPSLPITSWSGFHCKPTPGFQMLKQGLSGHFRLSLVMGEPSPCRACPQAALHDTAPAVRVLLGARPRLPPGRLLRPLSGHLAVPLLTGRMGAIRRD